MKEMDMMDRDNGYIWKYINIAVIICAGVLYVVLASFDVFWYDEAYTVGMIYRDYSDIIDITSQDVHTPFYYMVLKFFYETIGAGALVSIKYFSVIFFLLYLVIGSKICRKHFNRKIECFWLLLSCFMPAMVVQATSARMYTLALFWVTISAYLVYSLYLQESRCKWILLVVTTIIAIYIHTFSMIEMVVIYLTFIVVVLIKKRYQTLKRILIAGIIVACSYVPWLIVLWKQFCRWAGWESGWSNTIADFGVGVIKSFFDEWLSTIEDPQPYVVIYGVAFIVFVGIFALKYMCKNKQWLPGLGLLVAVIVLGIAIFVSIVIVPCFLGRYLFPLAGAVWLFFAVGIYETRRWWLQAILIIGVVICGFYTYYVELRLENEKGLSEYQEFIEQEWSDGDIIMADSYFTLMMTIYYPEKEYMVYGHMPRCIPFDNCEVFTMWEQLEDVDTVWYLSFNDFRVGNLDEKYDREAVMVFPFSYYNIVVEKCVVRD